MLMSELPFTIIAILTCYRIALNRWLLADVYSIIIPTYFPQIRHQVSKCSCSKKFRVIRVAEGQYRVSDLVLKMFTIRQCKVANAV